MAIHKLWMVHKQGRSASQKKFFTKANYEHELIKKIIKTCHMAIKNLGKREAEAYTAKFKA